MNGGNPLKDIISRVEYEFYKEEDPPEDILKNFDDKLTQYQSWVTTPLTEKSLLMPLFEAVETNRNPHIEQSLLRHGAARNNYICLFGAQRKIPYYTSLLYGSPLGCLINNSPSIMLSTRNKERIEAMLPYVEDIDQGIYIKGKHLSPLAHVALYCDINLYLSSVNEFDDPTIFYARQYAAIAALLIIRGASKERALWELENNKEIFKFDNVYCPFFSLFSSPTQAAIDFLNSEILNKETKREVCKQWKNAKSKNIFHYVQARQRRSVR